MNYYSNGEFTIEEVERGNGYPLKKTGPNQINIKGPVDIAEQQVETKRVITFISILQRDSSVELVLIMSTEND